MCKFLRTVAEALGRAGLKVITNEVRADWLFCGRGFKASWREMLRTRFNLFLEGGDCLLVTPDSLSVHSNVYLRNGQFNSCDVSVRQGEKEWYVWCGQGGRNSLEGTDVYL